MGPTQKFRDLSDEERRWLSEQRAATERLIANNPDAQLKYQTPAGKLGTIRAVLASGSFRPDQTFELQGLGIILGDALSAQLGLVWRMVNDDYGTSPCLVFEGTSIVIFPQTMISKRVERGETVDVFDLFNFTCTHVAEMRAKGY
jgi:hypothetical protein